MTPTLEVEPIPAPTMRPASIAIATFGAVGVGFAAIIAWNPLALLLAAIVTATVSLLTVRTAATVTDSLRYELAAVLTGVLSPVTLAGAVMAVTGSVNATNVAASAAGISLALGLARLSSRRPQQTTGDLNAP